MTGTVRLHRVFAAPAERVYRAFQDAAAMAKWLPPYGFTCTVHEFDPRVGGRYRMSFHNFSGGDSHAFGGTWRELIPNERIVFTTVLTEGWQPAEPWLALTAILTFEAKDGGTLYSARVLHKNPEDSAKHDEMGFQEGWGTAIGQLATMLEK